jgi:hypothetical protein
MLRVGKQPLVGRSRGSPTLKEAARETSLNLAASPGLGECWTHNRPHTYGVNSIDKGDNFVCNNLSVIVVMHKLESKKAFVIFKRHTVFCACENEIEYWKTYHFVIDNQE